MSKIKPLRSSTFTSKSSSSVLCCLGVRSSSATSSVNPVCSLASTSSLVFPVPTYCVGWGPSLFWMEDPTTSAPAVRARAANSLSESSCVHPPAGPVSTATRNAFSGPPRDTRSTSTTNTHLYRPGISQKNLYCSALWFQSHCLSDISRNTVPHPTSSRSAIDPAVSSLAGRTRRKNQPVWLFSSSATSSGVPSEPRRPPSSPPSGPRSIIQSADLITSRLCSITATVLPESTKRCNTSSNLATSAKCNPVVGSSRMYRVSPVATLDNSVASLTRCASPPERVVED